MRQKRNYASGCYYKLLSDGRWMRIHSFTLRSYEGRIISDLDDTLVDSKAAVLEAYRLAGADEVPWGRPWQEWTTPEIHERKKFLFANYYKSMVKFGPARMAGSIGCYVLTAASLEAWDLARQHFYPKLRLMAWGCTLEDKISILKRHIAVKTIYIDNDKAALLRMRNEGVTSCLIWCSLYRRPATAPALLPSEQTSLSSPLVVSQ